MNEESRAFPYFPILLGLSSAAFGCFPDWEAAEGKSEDSTDRGGNDQGAHEETVTIAALNVEDFDLGQTAEGQYDAVSAFAKAYSVDIFAVEEAQKDKNGDDEALFSEALKNVDYEMPYREFSSMSDGFNAQAVWSRFPLSNTEEILPENTRTVLRFTATVNGAPIVFLLCHLKSGDDEVSSAIRADEARRIESYITGNFDPTVDNIVVLGDMNTMTDADFETPGTLFYLSLKSNNPENKADDFLPVNLTELPDEATYPAMGSLLDHILLSPAARTHYVEDSAKIPTPKGDGPFGPSDHYPVMLELSM